MSAPTASTTALPGSMRAIEIARPGGPEVLREVRRPLPVPGPHEVLVQVRAAGVNRPDVSQRNGIYDPPPGASDLPGLDIAGIVRAVGAEVRRWRPGDEVCALVTGGGYAEFCVAPEAQCMALPRGFDAVRAAALPEIFATAWVNLFEADLGRLAAGEAVLIQGGSSGVGIAAIQLARRLRDATVVATAGSAEKRAFCVALGAAAAIDYRADWVEAARQARGGEGYDLVLDAQAGPYTAPELRLLRTGGRLVLLATHLGTHADIDLRDLMRRRLTLTGSTLRPRPVAFKARILRRLEQEVWPLLESGAIDVKIDRVLPLADARLAHEHLERGDQMGKVILVA